MAELTYPLDPTGSSATNRITDELHVLSPPSWADFYFIVPKLAPYFRESLTITNVSTGELLIEGVDWLPTHHFISASRGTYKPVYGSISFLDKTFSGVVKLSYNTLGGKWIMDSENILALLTNIATNPRITTWEQVLDNPGVGFPTIPHAWNTTDMIGMSEVKDAVVGVGTAIIEAKNNNDQYYKKTEIDQMFAILRAELL